jgi:hypothetical protein
VIAHLLAKTFHRLPHEILQEEDGAALLRAWQLEQAMTPKER